MDNTRILIIVIVVIILMSMYQYLLIDQNDQVKTIVQNDENPTEQKNDLVYGYVVDPVAGRNYDYRTFADPLVPPYKRDDYMLTYPSYPTRGFPTSFKKMGLLIDDNANNDDQYKFMILVGRQKYQNSNYYDYYVTENKNDATLKFDLTNIHKEYMDDDKITIPELNKTYRIKIDRNLGFEYNPYVL
jgi:hypothetical protein